MNSLTACGLFASGLASGISMSYPILCNPAFLYTKQVPIFDRLKIWQSTFKGGAATIPTFSASAIVAFWLSDPRELLWPIVSIVSIVPYTLVFLIPVNKRLLELCDKPEEVETDEVESLFRRWANIHLFRPFVITLGFVLALYKTIGK